MTVEKWKECEYLYTGLWKPICQRYKYRAYHCHQDKCKFYNKIIIIGNIWERYIGYTPIEVFEEAIKLSQQKGFLIHTNNAQLIEALEVLCGEKNINIYLKIKKKEKKINILTAYNYLGNIYDIIDEIRGKNIAQQRDSFERNYPNEQWLKKKIKEYRKKYGETIK